MVASFPKARRFDRTPVLFASVQIGNEAKGLILNGSEGGICVQITSGSVGPGLVDLQFQSAEGHAAAWVGCRGRVIWKSEDRTVVGIEFVDSTPLTNREIKNWLSFGQSLRELRREWPGDQSSSSHWANGISEPALPSLALPVEPPLENSAPMENPAPESEPEPSTSPLTAPFGQTYEAVASRFGILRIAVVISLVILAGAAILMKLHKSGWNFRKTISKIAESNHLQESNHIAASTPASAAVSAPQPAGPAPIGPRPIVPPPADSTTAGLRPAPAPAPHIETKAVLNASTSSGLMLQAGAMTDEQNAKEMAQLLQQKHFPAFVYKKDGDRFYRVFVGPYASDQSLVQAQAALRGLNISTIKKKNAH
jgi:septal ring-binding cell division protein DamX